MKTLNAQELKSRMQSDETFTLINTLDEEHFEKTHIPESVNVPQNRDDFVTQVEQVAGGKQQPVIVYCASAECQSSTKAAEKLEAAGFTDVYDFEAGAKGWQESGEKLAAGATN